MLSIILHSFIADIANWYDTLRYSVFLHFSYNEAHQHDLYIWSALVLSGQECGLLCIPCSVSLAAGLKSARMLCYGQRLSWSH